MLCQKCNKRTKVTDSRFKEDTIIRTRRCQNKKCDKYNVTYKTREEVVTEAPKQRKTPPPPSKAKKKKAREIKRTPNPLDTYHWEEEDDFDYLTDEELETLIGGGND